MRSKIRARRRPKPLPSDATQCLRYPAAPPRPPPAPLSPPPPPPPPQRSHPQTNGLSAHLYPRKNSERIRSFLISHAHPRLPKFDGSTPLSKIISSAPTHSLTVAPQSRPPRRDHKGVRWRFVSTRACS